MTAVTPPTRAKKAGHWPARVIGSSSTKTSSIATSGIVASHPSTRPRFAGTVESVTQAAKAASFAPEPTKLMTQSSAMIATTAPMNTGAASAVASGAPTRPKAAVTGVAAWFLVRERGVAPREQHVLRAVVDGLRPATVRREPALFLTLAIWCVIGISSQVFIPFVLIYLNYSLALEASAIALGIVLVLASALSVIGGRVMDRVGKERFLLPAGGVFVAGLVAMTFVRDFAWVILAATFMMAGMMASIAAVSAMTRDQTPADRAGGVQGARMISAVMVPMMIGPAIGAAVISGAAHSYVELGREHPVPGPEIFPVAALVLLAVPVLFALRARVMRRGAATAAAGTTGTTTEEARA